ncbi:para-nitrobenzyl esterase-like isoform X2 [Mercenaria mercenaria]|uniref:para-nitrobenzyl esterase-like isoform X2 n=1 Tax=Mercenaria mercenaria TaxID=6596 RepID=UPI00234ED24A|nr:para-nitrobenzyl esterase-like isoform X2 [Mercenaria mercenaria]
METSMREFTMTELILLCTVLSVMPSLYYSVKVQTQCGPVDGIQTDGVNSFRGIPYALPPVGRLRWKPPVELSPEKGNCWNGTLLAHKYGNTCFQISFTDPKRQQLLGSEDCLYLNVISPSLNPTALKPVMVWIHGGYLQCLNGNWPLYMPTEKLAKETDTVIVGFNYRLHAFGFMALQVLADQSPTNTSGNYGFMDMIAVLKWVQSNIKNFGGDPNRVTVFGQSSGGTSIFALLSSPFCKGLFQRAWMLSGSPILNKTANDAFKDNEIFLKNTNCTDINCLYSLSSTEVTFAVPWTSYPYWAMTDQGDLPRNGYFDGALAIVDGSCANEIDSDPTDKSINNWTWTQYEDHVKQYLGTFGGNIANIALKLYPPNLISPEFQFTSMASDLRMNCPTDVLSLHAASAFTSPVYRYVVTSTPSSPVFAVGIPFPATYSFHLWDVFAFFGFIPDYIKHPTDFNIEWQRNVKQEVMTFVRTGKPSTFSWKPFPFVTASLSHTTEAITAYHPVQCDFWLKNGFFDYAWIN